MSAVISHDLITYVESDNLEWVENGPNRRRKVLFHDLETGQRTTLVQWDAGYQSQAVDNHKTGEYLYILSGTFVDQNRASGPGTYIHNLPGSWHQPSTPDGCTFLVVIPARDA